MEIVLASGNPHKLREIREILPAHTIRTPLDIGIPFEYEEVGATYLANALGKAEALFALAGRPVLADDSGISVPALDGRPGVYSARYGNDRPGLPLDDVGRYRLLLEEMHGKTDRRAFYVCCMVLIVEPYRMFVCQETMNGAVGHEPIGTGGFGYDPIFVLPEHGKTVGQIASEEKHRLSHRGKAGRRIGEILTAIDG
jgi:XTP/dITP diphosphohydrolase